VRRSRRSNEHLRLIAKQEAGCRFFVTQVVYDLNAAKNLVSDYRYGCESLGLARALRPLPAPAALLILPRRYPVPPITLRGARRYQRGGIALAQSVGDSEEFVSLRDYRPGDPLKRIHWRSWARIGRPVVREYQDEFFVRHALVLDTFAAAPTPAFEEAVSVAASFACTVGTQDSLLDLLFVGPEAHSVMAGRGVGHVDRMLEILAAVRPCRDRPFDACCAIHAS